MARAYIEKYELKDGEVQYIVRWRIRHAGKTVDQGSKSFFGNRTSAEEFMVNKTKELEARKTGVPFKGESAVEDFFTKHAAFREADKPATYRNFDKPAYKYFQEYLREAYIDKLSQLTDAHILGWQKWLAEGKQSSGKRIGATTRSMYTRCIRAALNEAAEDHVVPRLRFAIPKPEKKRERIIPDDIMQMLLEAMPMTARFAVMAMFYMGVRRADFASMDYSQFKMDANGNWNVNVYMPKVDRYVYVRLHPMAVKALWPIKAHGKVWRYGVGWLTHAFIRAKKRVAEKHPEVASVVLEKRLHDVRHTFATRYMQGGGDIFALQALCGWRDLKTAEGYQHINAERTASVKNVEYSGDFAQYLPNGTDGKLPAHVKLHGS